MVNAIRGILLTCDPALKEYLIFLDKELHFIMQDLDDNHLLVSASVEKFLTEKMEEWYDQVHYTVPMYAKK